ncbi:MAG TPA: SAM-dependent methyltransferase [Sphingomonas bacterium]|jgi:S-adenosylmethionine-diacylgycerolhomoserine-N-methlytransferase|uniref:SAM-dependent methyltransferase n=1 Tax=Sphingomonas bacterium TaxID=1895847 RepID=A0A3D0WD32_9SPHN|nr:SAM-dependent methyltransferase [Sphingomonas bacterium]
MSAAAHAARMDAIYAGQRHIYDVTRKYYLLGRDRLIDELAPPPGGSVVEVGCGTGRNLMLAARRWPQARCFGFDISDAMLATARAKVAGRAIRLERGDATAWEPKGLFGIEAADAIFMSYTLSMIPDWRSAIAAACDALAPGGALHIVDFGQQERLPAAFHRALFAWLARFDVEPRTDLPRALEEAAAARGLSLGFTPLYRGYAWRAVLRRPA